MFSKFALININIFLSKFTFFGIHINQNSHLSKFTIFKINRIHVYQNSRFTFFIVFRCVFGNETFYEIITTKNCGEISNFSCSPWAENENGQKERHMHYEFSKTIAFSKLNLSVDQVQTQCDWSTPGVVYGVNNWSRTTGVMYSDYMHLDIHIRLEKINDQTKITVMCHVVWDKSTLMKSRIEKETYNGTKEYYECFEKELMSEKSTTGHIPFPKIHIFTKFTLFQKLIFFSNSHFFKFTIFQKSHFYKIHNFTEKSMAGVTQNGEVKSNGNLVGRGQDSKKSSILSFDERTVFVAFVMIIITLLVITFALIKLAASIASLSERLANLEDLLAECSNQCNIIT